jgi:DinB family protein
MKYLSLSRPEREVLWKDLEAMPEFLRDRFSSLSDEAARAPGPGGAFSPVEQCWHLADLEREGFGARIRRLLDEDDPYLPDFDGARLARERDYRSRSLGDGLAAFRAERASNLALLRSVSSEQWSRGGRQEGVGRVAICDLPSMMAEHDASHRAEIDAWGKKLPERVRPKAKPRSRRKAGAKRKSK